MNYGEEKQWEKGIIGTVLSVFRQVDLGLVGVKA